MLPKVSIIIPIYNTQDYVVDCVASALNQTYQNIEIILVNDGSTDLSMEIINRTFNDSRIVILNQINQGLSAARNTGIKHATGEYLFFLDSDDAIVDEAIEILVNNISGERESIIVGNHVFASSIEDINFANYAVEYRGKIIPKQDYYQKMFLGIQKEKSNFCSVWGKLYPKKIILQHLFPTGRLHEDEFVNYLYIADCSKVIFVDSPLYFYRDTPNSITKKVTIKRLIDIFDAYYEKFLFFKKDLSITKILYPVLTNLIHTIVTHQDFEKLNLETQLYYYSIQRAIFR